MKNNSFIKMLGSGLAAGFCLTALAVLNGCGGRSPAQQENQQFFTSGSRQADQRASQRMAQAEQLAGSGAGAGEKGVKPAVVATNADSGQTNRPAEDKEKLALYDRLGGEQGVSNIVADFLPRAMQDPRVNWDRKGVTRGGFSFERGESVTWDPSRSNVAILQKHLCQFISLATGGPSHYQGKEIAATHAKMHITNPEFDATVGDLKASLDKLQIANQEQKELLAIIESTRPEIVTEH